MNDAHQSILDVIKNNIGSRIVVSVPWGIGSTTILPSKIADLHNGNTVCFSDDYASGQTIPNKSPKVTYKPFTFSDKIVSETLSKYEVIVFDLSGSRSIEAEFVLSRFKPLSKSVKNTVAILTSNVHRRKETFTNDYVYHQVDRSSIVSIPSSCRHLDISDINVALTKIFSLNKTEKNHIVFISSRVPAVLVAVKRYFQERQMHHTNVIGLNNNKADKMCLNLHTLPVGLGKIQQAIIVHPDCIHFLNGKDWATDVVIVDDHAPIAAVKRCAARVGSSTTKITSLSRNLDQNPGDYSRKDKSVSCEYLTISAIANNIDVDRYMLLKERFKDHEIAYILKYFEAVGLVDENNQATEKAFKVYDIMKATGCGLSPAQIVYESVQQSIPQGIALAGYIHVNGIKDHRNIRSKRDVSVDSEPIEISLELAKQPMILSNSKTLKTLCSENGWLYPKVYSIIDFYTAISKMNLGFGRIVPPKEVIPNILKQMLLESSAYKLTDPNTLSTQSTVVAHSSMMASEKVFHAFKVCGTIIDYPTSIIDDITVITKSDLVLLKGRTPKVYDFIMNEVV